MTGQRLQRALLAAALVCVFAVPAAAQRYTAKQNGDVIDLADTTAQMNVSVVSSMSNAWRIQVKGKDLVRTAATLAEFEARPGLSGMPLLAPFANRLDETAFYANGKKYNFDLELGNVRGPIPSTGYVNGSKAWQLIEFKADAKSAWVTCKLDFYKNPQYMKQFPFAHTITMTYRVSQGMLEVRTQLDNLSTEPMPVVVGFHPIYELPDGNRDDWTVSVDAKTHWIEIPQRLPTGETQPIANFFNADKDLTAIKLKNYALIDDVFTDLTRDANGRATMKLVYNGKELHEILGPNYKTVLLWSTPLNAGGGGGRGRGAGAGAGARAGGPGPAPTPSGPFPVDPAQGVRTAPPAVAAEAPATPASPQGAPAPPNKGFIAFEPMVGITNALNLAHKGIYKELQTIPPGGSWAESFWITTKGY
ncbi:MAG: aldose 1-epimerase [Acidobacteriota bacterium]